MNSKIKNDLLKNIQKIFNKKKNIQLHPPYLNKNDTNALIKTLESKNISTYGTTTLKFENLIRRYTGAKYVLAVNSGTSALHLCILASGIKSGEEILIPALNFIASSNAAIYNSSIPHYIDCDFDLSINIDKLSAYLQENTVIKKNKCINLNSGKVIKGIIPTHVFGRISKINELKKICRKFKLIMIEDSSESFGSFYRKKHAGTFGLCGALSFNGNKIITTGGGGAVLTNSKRVYEKAKYLASTSKKIINNFSKHDQCGFNYRMPSLNAALGISQLKKIKFIKKIKKENHLNYEKVLNQKSLYTFLKDKDFVKSSSNYWLNYIVFKNKKSLNNDFFTFFEKKKIEVRRIWSLNNTGKFYKKYPKMDLKISKYLEKRILCLPSGIYKKI
ncbi:aminotransferase class I/II-fold pyridoxal phosphate-dependent enzyme [Candidatus Pelagibacter sp.]|nr:aminotransferase class I/II-fold pyridoxal phosphate-dependent enzyme [Candidatus Pelagibacter sp.]